LIAISVRIISVTLDEKLIEKLNERRCPIRPKHACI